MTHRLVVTTGIICASALLITWNLRPTIAHFAVSEPTQEQAPVSISEGLSVGWVGDMVPSTDASYNSRVFGGVQEYLRSPKLMIGNLEGTFAQDDRISKCVYITSMCHAFSGNANFADALKDAGFDVVSLVNNHSYDFGDEGLTDTTTELDRVGIAYISPKKPTLSTVVDGKKIGILGLSSTPPAQTITDYEFITKKVAELKKEHDYVIVIFHGGAEGAHNMTVPYADEYLGTENRGNVALVARTAIDAGADLVLGSGPHVLRKIESYNGKTIAYSLGNFVGGKDRLQTKGSLGLSGIMSTNLLDNTHTFISVLLNSDGIPDIDASGQSALLLKTLK